MLEEKVEQTIDNCKHIEVLESIIKNPNLKIEDIIKDKKIFFNGFKLDLVISLSQFLINKDQTITKSKRTEDERFNSLLLDKYAEVYQYQNNQMSLSEFIDQINIIRNGIAHGKYTINPETLNIKLEEKNIEINYGWFRDLIETKFVNNKNKLKKLPIKTGYIEQIEDKEMSVDNIEELLNNFQVFDYYITSENENFDAKALELIQEEIQKIKENAKKIITSEERLKDYNKRMENCKHLAKFGKLDFESSIYKMTDLNEDTKTRIKQIVNENYSKLKGKDGKIIKFFLEGCINDFFFDKDDYMQIDKALSQIKRLAIFAQNNKNLNYNQLKEIKKCLPPTDNQMLLATTLAKFNMLYSYNNENIFKKELDFSKLELSNLKPSINIDINTSSYKNDEIKITSLKKDVNDDYKRYLGMTKNIKSEKQKEASEKVNLRIYNKLFEMLDIKENIENTKYDNKKEILDKERYNENKLILMHLRNAITHGHIVINSRIKNNDLSTCNIKFEDYNIETGEKTFQLETTLDQIAILNDYEKVLGKLENNKSLFKKQYNGFASLLILSLVTFIESSAILFYALLKFGITLK